MRMFPRLLWQIPYSIWCWLWFAVLIITGFLLIFPLRVVVGKGRFAHTFCHVLRGPLAVFGWVTGIRFVYPRTFAFDVNRPYVFIANHTSALDMAFAAFTPLNIRVLAKAEIKKIPFLNLIGNLIAVYVQRFDEQSRVQSLAALHVLAKEGWSLVIFPEGTRHKSQEALGYFHKGAFEIALTHQLPLLPAIITGGRKVLGGKKALLWHPGTMTMQFLPPVETAGLALSDLNPLRTAVRADMVRALMQNESGLTPVV